MFQFIDCEIKAQHHRSVSVFPSDEDYLECLAQRLRCPGVEIARQSGKSGCETKILGNGTDQARATGSANRQRTIMSAKIRLTWIEGDREASALLLDGVAQ